jgi:soluble lytic murein transglycosylase
MREESAFHEGAVSPADAYGLMQVIPDTARHFGKQAGVPHDKDSLVRGDVSITLGSHVLSSYGERFPDDPLLAIPAYNAGPGRPKRWLEQLPGPDFDLWVELIPYRETRRYTKRVLASRAAYAFLYYRSDANDPFLLPLKLHGSSSGG